MTEPARYTAGSIDWRLYAGLGVVMIALRQSFWLWTDARLLFGMLPIGLAYQVGYSLLAAVVMWALVRWAWPAELEHLERQTPTERTPKVRR